MLTLSLSDAEHVLKITKPTFLLVGRSGTGKSTFAKKLVKSGYLHLELDKVVRTIAKEYNIKGKELSDLYGDIYLGRAKREIMSLFVQIVRECIKSKYVVIDGSLGHEPTIRRILGKDAIIVFLYPESAKSYYERLVSRLHDSVKIKNYKFGEMGEIIEEYEANGMSKKTIRLLKKLARFYTEKGRLALERFSMFENVIKVLV